MEGCYQRREAFFVGSDGNAYLDYWDGTNWVWEARGHSTASTVSGGAGAITFVLGTYQRREAFFIGSDGNAYLDYWDGTNWVWEGRGHPTASLLVG